MNRNNVWSPFVRSTVDPNGQLSGYNQALTRLITGQVYSSTQGLTLSPGQTVSIRIWNTLDQNNFPVVRMGVKGKFGGSLRWTYWQGPISQEWIGKPINATTPSVAFKFMASLAQVSGESEAFYKYFSKYAAMQPFNGWSISNIKFGLVNNVGAPKGSLTSYSNLPTCYKMDDMASDGKINLRVRGKPNVTHNSVISVGDRNHSIEGKFAISNDGIPQSVIKFTNIKITKKANGATIGVLTIPDIDKSGGQQAIDFNYSPITCREDISGTSRGNYNGSVDLEFTFTDGSTYAPGIDQNLEDTSSLPNNFPGSLLVRKYFKSFPYKCQKLQHQAFSISNTSIKSVVNSTGKIDATLTISSTDNTPLTSGQFTFAQDSGAAASLTAQSIVVNPVFSPNNESFSPPSPTDLTMTKTITISAACGASPGPQTDFQAKVSDSTENTEPYLFPVSLTCLGPVLSDPTPNPVSISANVGDTATGSFSFSNSAQADDQGRKAPLHFTVTGSGSLSVSTSGGTLAGGNSQSVTVNYPCTTAGTFNATATVTSSDEGVGSKSVGVAVNCREKVRVYIGRALAGFVSGHNGRYENDTLTMCTGRSYSEFIDQSGLGHDYTYQENSGLEPIIWGSGWWWADCTTEANIAKAQYPSLLPTAFTELKNYWLTLNTLSAGQVVFDYTVSREVQSTSVYNAAAGEYWDVYATY